MGVKAQLEDTKHQKLKQTDWRKVREYVDREEEREKTGVRPESPGFTYTGEAYNTLRSLMENKWTRTLDICGRSKRWGKQEFKDLRRKGVKDKQARKELKRKIRESKAKCWGDWIEQGKDMWQIMRVARNPFQLKERCHTLELEDGTIIQEDDSEGKCRAFVEYNVIHGHSETVVNNRKTTRITPSKRVMEQVRRALEKTKSLSTPGPDGISWRLLKAIKDTKLGTVVLEDIG